MTSAADTLVTRLVSEKEKTITFFSALPVPAWEQTLYTEGQSWTIREVFQHLVEAEGSILRLMKHVRSGGGGVPEDFDLDAYNERKVHAVRDLSLNELMERFLNRRDDTIKWVSDLSDLDLAREGRHPFLGIAPIEAMIKLMYRHTQLHQRDIRRLLKGE